MVFGLGCFFFASSVRILTQLAKVSNLAINPEYRKKSEEPLPLNELPHTDPYKNERIRQAKWSFNFLLGLASLAPITLLISISLYLTGNVPAATQATAAGGALGGVIVVGRKLYKDTNDRLDNTVKNSTEKASGFSRNT